MEKVFESIALTTLSVSFLIGTMIMAFYQQRGMPRRGCHVLRRIVLVDVVIGVCLGSALMSIRWGWLWSFVSPAVLTLAGQRMGGGGWNRKGCFKNYASQVYSTTFIKCWRCHVHFLCHACPMCNSETVSCRSGFILFRLLKRWFTCCIPFIYTSPCWRGFHDNNRGKVLCQIA